VGPVLIIFQVILSNVSIAELEGCFFLLPFCGLRHLRVANCVEDNTFLRYNTIQNI